MTIALSLTKILRRGSPPDLLAARRDAFLAGQVDEAIAKVPAVPPPPEPQTFEDRLAHRLAQAETDRAGWRAEVSQAVAEVIEGINRSPVFTRNERRAVGQAMLALRQKLGLMDG